MGVIGMAYFKMLFELFMQFLTIHANEISSALNNSHLSAVAHNIVKSYHHDKYILCKKLFSKEKQLKKNA